MSKHFSESGKEKLTLNWKKPPAEPGPAICRDWLGVRGRIEPITTIVVITNFLSSLLYTHWPLHYLHLGSTKLHLLISEII